MPTTQFCRAVRLLVDYLRNSGPYPGRGCPRLNPEDLKIKEEAYLFYLNNGRPYAGYTKEDWWFQQQRFWWFQCDGRQEMYTLDSAVQLLFKKNDAYGNRMLKLTGDRGILVRSLDKICRIQNLLTADVDPAWESIDDNLQDLLNYGILAWLLVTNNLGPTV